MIRKVFSNKMVFEQRPEYSEKKKDVTTWVESIRQRDYEGQRPKMRSLLGLLDGQEGGQSGWSIREGGKA